MNGTNFLKLIRNFLPMLVGYAAGGYFAVKYYLLLATPQYAVATRFLPLSETPEVYIDFYISVVFIVSGLLLNFLWIFVLAKMGVD